MSTHAHARSATASPSPFWGRIPRFFLFPLYPSVLGRLVLLAALPVLSIFTTSVKAGIVVFLGVSLLAWIIYLRQGSRIFCETSRGRLSPEHYNDETDDSLTHMPYAMFALCFVASFAVGIVEGLFGRGPAVAANLLVTLLMPASLMVLVHTRSLMSGLTPSHQWELISTLGKAYLLLCLFLFCLSSGQMFLTVQLYNYGIDPIVDKWMQFQEALRHVRSEEDLEIAESAFVGFNTYLLQQRARLGFTLFGFNAAAMYFTTIAFNMMGYVLYQYHQPLGIAVDEPRSARGSRKEEPRDEVADQIAALLSAGQMDKALDVAYEEQRVEPDSLGAQERYHKLLHLAGKTDRLLQHANRLIALLLRKQMPGKAFEVLRRCREQAPEFRPEDPATLLALAQAARSTRDPKLALDLMRSFDKNHPRHPLTPEVYSLSARILCEDLRKDDIADHLFATLLERYPDHPCAVQAREYRSVLARMQQSPQGQAAN